MVDYTALKNAWTASPSPPTGVTGGSLLTNGLTTAQKLTAINAWMVAGPNQDVPISAVVSYLGLNAKLTGLMKYAASAPATSAGVAGAELAAIINCPNAPPFQASKSAVFGTLEAMLTALSGDPTSGISAADVTALLALASTSIPWWQSNGYTSPFNANDLELAGGLS